MVNPCRAVNGRALAGLFALCAALAGCDRDLHDQTRTQLPGPFEAIQKLDLRPQLPQQVENSNPTARQTQGATYYGVDEKPDSAPANAAPSGEGFELNFENAAITTVAKVIIGDILGSGYTIDPRVQGTVTLSSGRPVPKGDLVFVLENALRMSNVVLVSDSGGYRLIPAGDVQSAGATRTAGAEGYGITVVPLRYASAQTTLKLLDSFAIKTGTARVDTARNMILVQGSGPERAAALETIKNFDVDWMRGQSVGVYPIKNATPEAIIKELEKVMGTGEGGLNNSLVTLQPIGRLNAVLVVSRKPNLLKTAAMWIDRLDKSNNAGAAVRVYRLHYGDAKQIAKVLNDLFGSRSSSGLDSASNQIAPGGGVSASSSDDRLAAAGDRFSSSLGSGRALTSFDSQSGGAGSSTSASPTQGQSSGLGSGDQGLGGSAAGSSTMTARGSSLNRQSEDQSTAISLPGIRITADVANNALVIYSNQENYRLIEKTLGQLDRQQLQVAIHATIAEVTLNNTLQYGVQYAIQSSDIGLGADKGSAGLVNTATSAVLSRVLPGGNLLLGPETSPRVIIDALRSITDVKVLSTPSVVVLDNQVATLLVGDQIPITTQSATVLTNSNLPLVNTVDYRNTGVILRVSPRVNINGNVVLQIEQEISSVAPNANAALALTPTISQRKIKSSIAVASEQAVLLGGLISETQQRGRSGIPLLEEIPYVGDLFSQNSRVTARTELVIFIQPQIIRNSVDAYKVAEELRSKLKGSVQSAFPPGPSLRKDPLLVR